MRADVNENKIVSSNFMASNVVILGFVYNFAATEVRLLAIILWTLSCLFYARKVNLSALFFSFSILLPLIISLFFNLSNIKFTITGAGVESLVAFLIFPYLYVMLQRDAIHKLNNLKYVLAFVISVFFIDAVYRYFIAPEYFLNYDTRHQAKTIGFFSTANVSGAALSFLSLFFLLNTKNFSRLWFVICFLLLITTMARAAVLGLIVSIAINFLFKKNIKLLLLGILLAVVGIFAWFQLDLSNDGSLLSKFLFLKAALSVAQNMTLGAFIFGYGIDFERITSVLGVNGWSPHIPLLKAFLYFGILGLIVYAFSLLKMLNRDFLPYFICYGIISLAGAPIVFPMLLSLFIMVKSSKMVSNEK